ncbi:hypothetical protein QR680_018961 [Steinernema hermaphroditum]|uniref:Uncharacterized protein n=1 Tax=Steinernema hermaphroditum TaxID=289476 RepID=A0AA39HJJ6_9BILA|nr:hypothetical protein QR680_018961 [Steinernema hermaphroditum]
MVSKRALKVIVPAVMAVITLFFVLRYCLEWKKATTYPCGSEYLLKKTNEMDLFDKFYQKGFTWITYRKQPRMSLVPMPNHPDLRKTEIHRMRMKEEFVASDSQCIFPRGSNKLFDSYEAAKKRSEEALASGTGYMEKCGRRFLPVEPREEDRKRFEDALVARKAFAELFADCHVLRYRMQYSVLMRKVFEKSGCNDIDCLNSRIRKSKKVGEFV